MPIITDPLDPAGPVGSLKPFTGAEETAMEIEEFGVRDRTHYVESRRVTDNVMTRVFFCKFSERFRFCELVLGDVALYDDAGTWKLSRLLPSSTYGRHPESTSMIATRIDDIRLHSVGITNELTPGQIPTGPKAQVTVFYEDGGFAIQSDSGLASERHRFTTRSSGTSEIDTITLPGATFKYTTAAGTGAHSIPVPFNVSWMRPVRRFSTTWHYLPNSLLIAGGALFERLYVGTAGDGVPFLGCVNSQNLELPSLGTFPAGTLLLEGFEDRSLKNPLTATGLSSLRWDAIFKWAFTARGWLDLPLYDPVTTANTGYHRVSNNGTHYAVSAMPDNTGLYNVRDMSLLWSPDI